MDTQTHERTTNEISKQDVILFMNGMPQAPQCGFSSQDDDICEGVRQLADNFAILYQR